jgi:uncharacterized membrane protein
MMGMTNGMQSVMGDSGFVGMGLMMGFFTILGLVLLVVAVLAIVWLVRKLRASPEPRSADSSDTRKS